MYFEFRALVEQKFGEQSQKEIAALQSIKREARQATQTERDREKLNFALLTLSTKPKLD